MLLMSISKYFEVYINDNNYRIVESPKKHGSALTTLQKIETIISKNLKYFSPVYKKDSYSEFSSKKLRDILREKSIEIHEGYTEKQSKLNWIIRKIFSKEKKVAAIHDRISSYLDKIQMAEECGYKGDDGAEAIDFINTLFKQIATLDHELILPRNIVKMDVIAGELTLNQKSTLENLKNLTTERIFQLYSHNLKKFKEFSHYLLTIRDTWNVTEVNTILEKEYGQKALSLAIREGNERLVELLLKHKADCPDALIVACCDDFIGDECYKPLKPKTKIIKLLLQHGTYPNPKEQIVEPFRSALDNQWLDIARLFLENEAEIDQNSLNDFLGSLCVQNRPNRNQESIELLLEYGANPNMIYNDIPLIFCIFKWGDPDLIPLLLPKVNVSNIDPANYDFDKKSLDDLLGELCMQTKPNKESVALLLGFGANPNMIYGKIPLLFFIVKHGDMDLIPLFYDKVNVSGADSTTYGFTQQWLDNELGSLCVKRGSNKESVELLLKLGANPSVFYNDIPLLHCILSWGNTDLIPLLLDKVDVNELDPATNGSALAYACGFNTHRVLDYEVIKLLLDSGAKPNIATKDGSYPLKLARENQREDIVELLKEYGAEDSTLLS